MTKTCRKCNVEKPFSEFTPQKKGKYGLCGRCKECLREIRRLDYKTNPQRIKELIKKHHKKHPEAKRRNSIKSVYGITSEQHIKLEVLQNYSCGICQIPETQLKRKMDIDHSHTTNRVRGLLCPKCNKALGLFNDDINILKKAIDYLMRDVNPE